MSDPAIPADDGAWLLRGGEVLAAAEVAHSYLARIRGLLGRGAFDGALVLPHTRSVHTVGMRFAIDVAFLDSKLVVVDTVCMEPWRMTRPRLKCRTVLEAQAGAFERWRIAPGDQLELHLGS